MPKILFLRSRAPLPRRSLGEGGFTLVEVVLVLALLALVISVLLPAAGALLRGVPGETPEETVLEAVQDARRQAVLSGREVTLRYEPAPPALAWTDGVQQGDRAFGVGRVLVEFLRPGAGVILLGGQLVGTDPVAEMKFYTDGTCDQLHVQVRAADAAPRVIPLDPWTCAPVLGDPIR